MNYNEYKSKAILAGKPVKSRDEFDKAMMQLGHLKRSMINDMLQSIKEDVDLLLGLLPDEQQHLGSEYQIIDSAVNALYHKYAKPEVETE